MPDKIDFGLNSKDEESTTNITDKHKAVFEALTSGEYCNFALFSCFLGDEPTAAIVSIIETESEYDITPLFVAVTPKMLEMLVDHDKRIVLDEDGHKKKEREHHD